MGVCWNSRMLVGSLCLVWISLVLCHGKLQSKVRCSKDEMVVEVMRPDINSVAYLESLKNYPDKACQPELEENKATFRLSLNDVYRCGVTRVSSQLTGYKAYYHKVVVETPGEKKIKDIVDVKCIISSNATMTGKTRLKRNVLPAGFQEDELVQITGEFQQTAPIPVLNVSVRQGGQMVTGELNVNPGTPLQMEIFLNKESAPVYGLLVSYMQVTDTKSQEETIIFNGCSVDPYLFENFNTVDGDFLAAKFRAFKFPESTYVQFKGTVNVCLDKCKGVDCSNGQTGFGRRRRREMNTLPPDPNKVFEVTMTTFIKVNYDEDDFVEKGELLDLLRPRNETQVSARDTNALSELDSNGQQMPSHFRTEKYPLRTEEVREQFHYTIIEERNAAVVTYGSWSLLAVIVLATRMAY